MPENVLEYIVTDAFLQLWLTADVTKATIELPNKAVRTREMWLPELVAQFDEGEVPDCILVHEAVIHTNSEGNFHYGNAKEPTVSFKEMIILWGNPNKDNEGVSDLYSLDRKMGPARVVLTDVQKWHDNGLIHRRRGDAITCKQSTFTWAKKGNYMRPDGPYHVSLRGFHASGNRGEVTNIRLGSLVPSWATVNNRKLTQIAVRDVIKKNGIRVNLLAFESVFIDEEDEVIFLTEIAE